MHQKSVRLFFSGDRAGNCGIGPATAFHWLVLVFESVLRKSPADGGSIHGSFVHPTKYYNNTKVCNTVNMKYKVIGYVYNATQLFHAGFDPANPFEHMLHAVSVARL